ncbi:MAG: LamG domain-containing protein [Sandaracinaceae bacterium]|nr:LamG domain-containing protein [Sandaracinaceae bacterium]
MRVRPSSSLLAALLSLALGGCYATHGADDAGPIDARAVDAHGLDAPAVDGTAITPDAHVVGRDEGICFCASDSDCPPPPPSWNCLVPVCSACVCGYRQEPALCGADAFCDAMGNCQRIERWDTGPIDRPDASIMPLDAFVAPVDAFVAPVDAFVAPIDAFASDAGRPPTSDALRFTSDEVMTVPDRPALSIGPELTLELWVRLRSEGILAIKGDPSVGSHLYLEARPPDPDGVFRTFWVGWSYTGTRVIVEVHGEVPADTWTHFALVQRQSTTDRVEVMVYLNGESAVGPEPIDAGDVASYLASFNAAAFTVGHADMDVDEIRLWRIARGQSGIQAYMRSELSPGISGLIAYWPLDGVGQVVLDRSLNGNDGFRGSSPAADRADPSWTLDGAF